ncbi:hypothetical protein [Labilibaculum euxinus]
MRELKKSETVAVFENFSEKINGKLNTQKKSEIDSGGTLKYLTISIEKEIENSKIKINQTFSYLFSQPEEINVQTGLSLTIEKPVRANFYLHFWQRELFDKIFSLNKINSGNPDFDKRFSVKSNNPNLIKTIFNNQEIQNLFLTSRFLVFNVTSKDRIIKIKLKNMDLKKYEDEEIEKYYQTLLNLNKIIKV